MSLVAERPAPTTPASATIGGRYEPSDSTRDARPGGARVSARGLFGDWIDDQLRQRSWRAVDLVRASGGTITDSQVSRWRSGKALPSPATCIQIAEALGVSTAEVLGHLHPGSGDHKPTRRGGSRAEVSYSRGRWRRVVDGETLVAKRLDDLLDSDEHPVVLGPGALAQAMDAYHAANDRIRAARADRAAAIDVMLSAGASHDDLAWIIGVTPVTVRRYHHRVQP